MKTNNKYQDLYDLMNEKLLKQEQKVISCLALLLSMKTVLQFEDELDIEEHLTEQKVNKITNMQAILYPLLDSMTDKATLEETLLASELFSIELANDIVEIFNYRDENRNIRNPFFDSSFDKETFDNNSLLFLQRLVSICRVKCYLEEMISGIETYGVSPYCISEEDENDFDILVGEEGLFSSPEEMTMKQCIKELLIELSTNDEDSDEEVEDKMQLLAIISQVGKYKGK